MQIFTWNVRFENKVLLKGLEFIYSLNPDVICLQEFPEHKLSEVIKNTKYHPTFTEDFISHHPKAKQDKNGYILILTKEKPLAQVVFDYHKQQKPSLLSWFYRKIAKVEEQHKAVRVTLKIEDKVIKIVTARLSCAVSCQERLKQLDSLLKCADKETIFTGDFNIVDGWVFRFLTGWSRAYSLLDYKIREREKAEQIFDKYSLNNIFKKIRTSAFPLLRLQLDHILVPNDFQIFDKQKHKKRFFSDHNILSISTYE
jgi:endonuclease/exonuclease/phosphatase family metal-dependent hydrolase